MFRRVMTLILVFGCFASMGQKVRLKKELKEDVLKRFPNCEIVETTIRSGAYRVSINLDNGVVGVVSYRKSDDGFQQCHLTYEELPAELAEPVLKRTKASDIFQIKFLSHNGRPSYYSIRSKTGGLIFDENYQFLENGVLLNGLKSVPKAIHEHLRANYENVTIKETGKSEGEYFVRIEFKSGDVYAQAAIVKYTEEYQWINSSSYYWDLSTLPLEIFLALDNYGGIEGVKEARQFFRNNGSFYFRVELKGQKLVYFDQDYQEMPAPGE